MERANNIKTPEAAPQLEPYRGAVSKDCYICKRQSMLFFIFTTVIPQGLLLLRICGHRTNQIKLNMFALCGAVGGSKANFLRFAVWKCCLRSGSKRMNCAGLHWIPCTTCSKRCGNGCYWWETKKKEIIRWGLWIFSVYPISFRNHGILGCRCYFRSILSVGREHYDTSDEIRLLEHFKQCLIVKSQRDNAACVFATLLPALKLHENFGLFPANFFIIFGGISALHLLKLWSKGASFLSQSNGWRYPNKLFVKPFFRRTLLTTGNRNCTKPLVTNDGTKSYVPFSNSFVFLLRATTLNWSMVSP